MTVAVVTDSTSYLPAGVAQRLGIRVVPLRVSIDGRSGDDCVDISSADVTRALRARMQVTTSRPSPADLVATYQSALDNGATGVVSIHLSAALSGTWESARLASADFRHGTVRVVDSRSTGMALGFAVIAAAEAARAGAGASAVQDVAVATVDRTYSTFYVDTFEYLRRGGRVGAAAAFLGTSLSVKPLLHVANGQIHLLEKVRTSTKALARLLQLTVEAADRSVCDVAVHHLDAPARAEELAGRLGEAIPGILNLHTSEVGAVVGAHLGPGMLGTVVVRR